MMGHSHNNYLESQSICDTKVSNEYATIIILMTGKKAFIYIVGCKISVNSV